MKTRIHPWTHRLAWLLLAMINASNGVTDSGLMEPAGADTLAFVHAFVIPMDSEQVLTDQTVLVVAGRIQQVGPSGAVEIPAGTLLIDATGRYLLPAYCDMHTHVLGEAWNMLLPPGDKVGDADLDMESFLFPYIANGVTTIQVLSATPDHVRLRRRITDGEIIGPRLILASMIDGPDRAWPPPLSAWVTSAQEARQVVLAAKDAGYDAMKVYSFLDPAAYDAVISTAIETEMDVIGHIPMSLSVEQVLASGQRQVVHSEEFLKHAGSDFSQERVEQYADMIAASDTWLIPTLVTSRSIILWFENPEREVTRPEARFFSHPMQKGVWSFISNNLYAPIPADHRQWIADGFVKFQQPLVKALEQRGVSLIAGSDTPLPSLVPGFALHRELEELVLAGLSPYQALKASTTNPFVYLGEADEAGTIEAGKLANLVLLEANPLEDISNSGRINGVVVQGRWLPSDQINDKMELIATSSE